MRWVNDITPRRLPRPIPWVAALSSFDTVYVRDTREKIRSIGLVHWRSDSIQIVKVKWFSLHSYNMAQEGCFRLDGVGAPLTGSHYILEQYHGDLGREVDGCGLGQGVME